MYICFSQNTNTMSEQKLKIGDVVQLKSGGPKMTITRNKNGEPVGRYECSWFNLRIQSSAFSELFPEGALVVFSSNELATEQKSEQ